MERQQHTRECLAEGRNETCPVCVEIKDRRALKAISERVTRAVCDVEDFVTAAEADELDRLRAIVGEDWDAINGRWEPLDCEGGCGMKAVRGFRTCRWESCEQEVGE